MRIPEDEPRRHDPLHSVSVPPAPKAFAGGRLARFFYLCCQRMLPVSVRVGAVPDKAAVSDPRPALVLTEPAKFFQRLQSNPKIGIGESYMAGEWSAADGTDLAALMTPFAANLGKISQNPIVRVARRLLDEDVPISHRNTKDRSAVNVRAHYDLGNELFEGFLDSTMTYSSAFFDEATPFADQDLATAQRRKINAALDAAGVGSGTQLLEIGTGWGELAIIAASRGARVTSITLSREQHAYVVEKVAARGLSDRVEVFVDDYRNISGRYDAVVSIEMIEAVGEEFWPVYFSVIDGVLAESGVAVVQTILMAHSALVRSRTSFGWIQKYIFPGGIIPSLDAIDSVCKTDTSLEICSVELFGQHYAETLRRWRSQFLDDVASSGGAKYADSFARMWEFYLAYSEAGFSGGYLDVGRLVLRKRLPASPGGVDAA